MALAETTVVETVSDGWLQVPFELSMLLEADQLAARTRAERLRREARDDGGGGDCRASGSDGYMSWCLDGAWMSSNTRGLSRGRSLSPFGTSLTVRAPGSVNETHKPSGDRANVSEPVPAAARTL